VTIKPDQCWPGLKLVVFYLKKIRIIVHEDETGQCEKTDKPQQTAIFDEEDVE
jgi:hypothetical protein